MLDGKSVVDIWAGYADKAKTRPWTRDTLVNVYSTTKGVCAHRLADKGLLDLDEPVATYWPEFCAGRQGQDTGALSVEPSAGTSRCAQHSRRRCAV
jgi:CubicO group peptidase (beta-lactamase class C family)